ncbi:hypothetical protein BC827DRAFT_1266025 [Russula dissimulans]|nr:hypothetical protein BC827DRAFT_1266025 [Russula dissimulans]
MANLATLVSLLLLPGLVVAQINTPDCSLTWAWTFNTLGQNACTVAAYLMATCYGGAFSIASLAPGYEYQGPTAADTVAGLRCKCTVVAYSLISACDACQGEGWIDWSNYTANCPMTESFSTFPYPVPAGTRVPAWSLLDITAYANQTWDSNKAFAVGDGTELAPGEAISLGSSASTGTTGSRTTPTTANSPYPTSTSPSSDSSPSSSPTSHSSNVGAIAGGAAGGVAAVSIAGLAVFLYLRRRGPRTAYASVALNSSQQQQQQPYMGEVGRPLTDDGAIAPSPSTTPVTPMRLYDPNDPTTFPGYQPSGEALAPPGQVPISPYAGAGNTLANMQTAHGYHGLPTV